MSAVPSLFVLQGKEKKKIPPFFFSPWEQPGSGRRRKAKTYLSWLNKSDKALLYELPPEKGVRKTAAAPDSKWPERLIQLAPELPEELS